MAIDMTILPHKDNKSYEEEGQEIESQAEAQTGRQPNGSGGRGKGHWGEAGEAN